MRAAVVVSLSIEGGGHAGRVTLPLRSQQAATLPMWRPVRRVDAHRYVKEQHSYSRNDEIIHYRAAGRKIGLEKNDTTCSDTSIDGKEMYPPWRFGLLEMIICRQNG